MKRCLIVGMSHVNALRRAVGPEDSSRISVQNLNTLKTDDWVTALFETVGFEPDAICFLVSGNRHNILGMVEHPQRFSICSTEGSVVPDEADRDYISHGLVSAMFRQSLERHRSVLQAIRRRAATNVLIQLLPPPPVGDVGKIERSPGPLADKLHLGVPPKDLRIELYRHQVRMTRIEAEQTGLEVVPVPVEAFGGDGFLDRKYWGNDATHANTAYGRLYLDRIRERIDA